MLYQLSHFRSELRSAGVVGAESQSRTGDTAIFSRVLYQLSYLGPAVATGPERPDGVAEDSTGPLGPSIETGHLDRPAEERLEAARRRPGAPSARARRGARGGPARPGPTAPSSTRRQPPTPSPSRTMMWARITWATRAGGGSAGIHGVGPVAERDRAARRSSGAGGRPADRSAAVAGVDVRRDPERPLPDRLADAAAASPGRAPLRASAMREPGPPGQVDDLRRPVALDVPAGELGERLVALPWPARRDPLLERARRSAACPAAARCR